MNTHHAITATLRLCALSLVLTFSQAHAKHSPWVHLSAASLRAVGLHLADVQVRELHEDRTLYGHFVIPPGGEALVTPLIRGRITGLYAMVGDKVARGAPLARIESLLVGSPAPSVIVRAPMRGLVEARPVVLGQGVVPGTILYRLMNPKTLWLKAYVYQNEITQVHRGQLAHIHALGISKPIQGRVILKAPRINAKRGSETIWIKLIGPHVPLEPALFARADITVATTKGPTVPTAAILDVNGHHAVFVATSPGRFRYTPVVTGIRAHGYVTLSGLSSGSRVVTQGNMELFTLWMTGGKLRADS